MLVFLLILMLLMLVLQGIRADSSNDTANHSAQHAAPSLVSDEAAARTAEQRGTEALLAVWAAGTCEIRAGWPACALTVIAVLGSSRVRGALLLLSAVVWLLWVLVLVLRSTSCVVRG